MIKTLPSLLLAAAVWAHAQAPVAPTPAYPADKGVNIATAVSLKWKKVDAATGYEAQLASEPTFAAPLQDDSTLTDTLYHLSHLADTTLYYWRVRARNDAGFGPFSKARSFTTTPPLGAGPTIVSPQAGDMDIALEPILKWNTFAGTTTYGLQISTASNFSTLLFTDTSIADTLLKVTGAGLVKGTLYYWHVRANTSPVKSAWTKGSFSTVADAPTDAVVLTAPEDMAVDQPIPAYLSWNSVDRASKYLYQLSPQADFSAGVITDSSLYPYVSVDGLTANTLYYWHVKGISSTGQAPYSAVRQFKTTGGVSALRGSRRQGATLRAFPAAGRTVGAEFTLAAPGRVRILVYDAFGGRGETLADGMFAAGIHRVISPASVRAGGGIRFLELVSGPDRLVRSLVIP